MNIEAKALEQIHYAQGSIVDAMQDPSLTDAEMKNLEDASFLLRNLERAIVKHMAQDLINSLTADTQALKVLTQEIKSTAQQLSSIGAGLETVCNVMDAMISITGTALTAGLL